MSSSEKKERKVKSFTKIEIEFNLQRIIQFSDTYEWNRWFIDFPGMDLKIEKLKEKDTQSILQSLIVKEEKPKWREKVKFREDNKPWLRTSIKIAIKINRILRVKKISLEEFAKLIEIEDEGQVKIMLQGMANLDLKTISKIEKVLDVKLITIEYDN